MENLMLDLSYSNLLNLIQPYKVSGRTESTAFLHWFLVNLYRLDPMEVDDIVCDGSGDKGIDGIYINNNEELIDIFQSKIVQNQNKTLGDNQLKEFIGSLNQLTTEQGLESLDSTSNQQLKNLLIEHKDVLVSSGYSIRGIFVTNANKDSNSDSLIDATASSVRLEVWDKSFISQMYVASDKAIRATSELCFDVFGLDYAEYNVDNAAKVVIAPLSATDLVKMEGIHNQQIFDWNLRKSLGRTKVNKDILKSIDNKSEHNLFLLYHNGITIVCNQLDTSEDGKIKIADYAVVNGCQSLSCLYDKKNHVTKDLRILTRIIEVESNSELIPKITYNSNNQNGIKVRDFRSNTATQVRIQREIDENYPEYFYQIKSGEVFKNRTVIDNKIAGQILLTFDKREPWSIQSNNKIFDELYQTIFARPEVTGGRIVTLFKLYKEIQKDLGKIQPELFSRYQITTFILIYILGEVLSTDEVGKEFCKKPESFCKTPIEESNLFKCIHLILGDLIIDLNGEFEERGGENFDIKKTFKSANSLKALAKEVLTAYQKLVNRGRVASFSQLLENES
jgi:hypothetical protein